MSAPAVVERPAALTDVESAERTWPCTARVAQRPGQRIAPRSRTREALEIALAAVGFVVAFPLILICALIVAAPITFVVLWLGLKLLGLDSGTGGGGD